MVSDWRTEEPVATMESGAVVQTALGFTTITDLATLRVFPVKGKRPLMKGWQNATAIDMHVVAGWQAKHPGCNWGSALDADTLVVDCDCVAALSALYEVGEPLGGIPSTLTTLTPRGFHLWFRTPVPVKNRVAVLPGVDVRTKGGFVVVPPSLGADGLPYEFASMEVPIADAPDWLLQFVAGGVGTPIRTKAQSAMANLACAKPEPSESLTPFEQDVARRGWARRVGPGKVPDGRSPFALRIAMEPQNVSKGTRNAALFAYLCRLRRQGKADEFIRSEAWRVVARIPEPMSRFEVERIIDNALKFDGKAVGSNTLVEAWRIVEQIEFGPGTTKWYRFLLLVERLAEMRPKTMPSILLPVRSIGTLMNAHFTQVAKWRQRAVEMGILSNTAPYVRRSLAAEFAVKAGFSPLADGPAMYKVKRGRKPKNIRVELDQAA
jgi:Bifunctional DNA primase/polymerase, N-terminal